MAIIFIHFINFTILIILSFTPFPTPLFIIVFIFIIIMFIITLFITLQKKRVYQYYLKY